MVTVSISALYVTTSDSLQSAPKMAANVKLKDKFSNSFNKVFFEGAPPVNG